MQAFGISEYRNEFRQNTQHVYLSTLEQS